MPDAAALAKVIKQAALDAVGASKPSEICFGVVTGISPLKILVEQKMTLGEAQLILTKAVTDYWVDIEVNHYVLDRDLDPTHKHTYKGRKKIMIYNGLLVGEKVVLLRLQGGQQFIVLDRVCDHTVKGEWV